MKKAARFISLAYFAFAFMLLFGANGRAYIDPSVMTYLIQAIAGVVIAVGAVVGIYWRRAKKKVSQRLGVDENKGKEVESDEIEDLSCADAEPEAKSEESAPQS